MKHKNLKEHLQQNLVIGDGAMATLLYQLGVPVGTCYEELNLTNPALIRSVHEAYIQADAHLIETNTFRVIREILTRYGLEQKVKEVPEEALLSISPNAGRFGFVDGALSFKSSPEYFAEYALRLREQGVRVIGGCCGTTPEQIRAIAEALKGLSPLERINPTMERLQEIQVKDNEQTQTEYPVISCTADERTILDRVREEPTVIVEFDPPKDLDTEEFFRLSGFTFSRSGHDHSGG